MPEPYSYPYIADAAQAVAAADLITKFGAEAATVAAARAGHSRNLGNVVHFCRWRQIERLIALLSTERPAGTLH